MGGSHTDWSSSLCVRFGFYFFFHHRPLQISAVGWRATALTSVLFVWSFGCGFGGAFGWAFWSSRGALQDEMSAFMGGLVGHTSRVRRPSACVLFLSFSKQ